MYWVPLSTACHGTSGFTPLMFSVNKLFKIDSVLSTGVVAVSLDPHNIKLQHIEAKGVVIIRRHPVYDRTETDQIHAHERETGSLSLSDHLDSC